MAEEKEVGKVTGYFARVGVAAIDLTGDVKIGDVLHFKGGNTDFTITLESMQKDNQPVEKASPGDKVGIKVPQKARDNVVVYRAS